LASIVSRKNSIFTKLASTDKWYSSYNKFITPVRKALSNAAKSEFSKEASLLIPLSLAQGRVGETSKLLLGAGASAGILGGALAHMLTRQARQTSADNAALEAKIELYKRLKRDIQEDLINSGALDTPELDDDNAIAQKYAL